MARTEEGAMKKIFLILFLFSTSVFSSEPSEWERFGLILKQYDESGIDENRLFLSEFSYFGKNNCFIETVIIVNSVCSAGQRMMLKPEFSSSEYDGLECDKNNLGGGKRLITMRRPFLKGQIDYKAVLSGETYNSKVESFTGTLNKYSFEIQKVITAEFKPVKSSSFYKFTSIDINCDKIGDVKNSFYDEPKGR